jgi:hypothetical protein
MDYLTPFHVGWDEFVNMLIELLCWSTILFYDASFGSYVGLLRASLCFVLIIALTLFFELISRGMLLRGTQWLLFMNQILHLVNPHDKLSALCVSKS